MSQLFEPLTLRGLTLANRLWVPAMCMYSCEQRDGVPDDFHLVHLGARVLGGYGLVITEATAVRPDGRISPEDTGLWNDEQTAAWARINAFARAHGGSLGVQLAHAGRKASTYRPKPGEPSGSVPPEDGGWPTVAPSASAFPGLAEPAALTESELDGLRQSFADAARRAAEAGFDVVEIHAAHGYLLHEFLSPLVNDRTDDFGGSLENRMRFPLSVVDAVRAAWPAEKPLFVRISATDWAEGGWTIEDSCAFARAAAERGVDLIDVSSGGAAPVPIQAGPGYQVPLARAVRDTGIPVAAVGLINDVEHAEQVLSAGDADAVLFGRTALRDPSLPARAAGGAPGGDLGPWQYGRGW